MNFAPARPAYPAFGAAYSGGLAPYYGPDIVGQAADQTFMDKTKTFLGTETAGVKNGYWLGGAAALGAAALAFGWFKTGKRRGKRR